VSGIRRTNCHLTEFIGFFWRHWYGIAVGQKLIKPLAVSLVLIDPPAERSPEAFSPSGSHETDLAKARKQQKDGRSECRQVVALNPIEQLKAGAVELIGPWRF
jgi:hypothetical protein